MKIQPNIPEFRRRDPRRRAELEVYNQLAASDLAGCAIYEARASAAGPAPGGCGRPVPSHPGPVRPPGDHPPRGHGQHPHHRG